ncbi:hypothetical protein BSKO_00547 [Bryopsis sp. KO-2023]|nr:hypothetical protein BSKO_00547 [Bryopsis sp. KO-2023]
MGLGSSTGRGRCSSTGKKALLVSCKSLLPKDVWSASCYEILLAQQLLQKFGFCQDRIRCMTNRSSRKVDMLRSDMLKEGIDWLVDGAKPGDHLVFFFANFVSFQGLLQEALQENLMDRLPPGATLYAIFDGNHSGAVLDLQHALSCSFMGKSRSLGSLKLGVRAFHGCMKGNGQATVLQIAHEFAGFVDLSAIMLPTLHIPGLLTLTFIYAIESCGSRIRLSKLIDLMQESARTLQDSLTELLSIPLPEDEGTCVAPFVIQVLHAGELRVQFGQNKGGDIFMTVAYRGVSFRNRVLLSRETRSVGSWQVGLSLPSVSCNRHRSPSHRILV